MFCHCLISVVNGTENIPTIVNSVGLEIGNDYEVFRRIFSDMFFVDVDLKTNLWNSMGLKQNFIKLTYQTLHYRSIVD